MTGQIGIGHAMHTKLAWVVSHIAIAIMWGRPQDQPEA